MKYIAILIVMVISLNVFAGDGHWTGDYTIKEVQMDYPYQLTNRPNYLELIVTTTNNIKFRTAWEPASGDCIEFQKANQLLATLLSAKTNGNTVEIYSDEIDHNGYYYLMGVKIKE